MDKLNISKMAFYAIALVCAAPAPGAFPVVDQATQKTRDAMRRTILETELEAEKSALDAAKKALAEAAPGKLDLQQREVDRHAANVDSINMELSGVAKMTVVKASGTVRLPGAPAVRPAVGAEQVPFWDVYRRPKTNVPDASDEADATVANH